MILNPKLVGSIIAISSFILILIMPTIATPVQEAYASGKSPYESGYDHGCDDAGLSPSDRYINEPGKGPSFHTDEFMDGYNSGYNACSDGGSDGERQFTDDTGNGGSSQGGKTLEDYCVEYLGKSDEECSRMADGNDIKVPGLVYLLCNAIRIGGVPTTGGLSALLNC
jgi:hypothetical protein